MQKSLEIRNELHKKLDEKNRDIKVYLCLWYIYWIITASILSQYNIEPIFVLMVSYMLISLTSILLTSLEEYIFNKKQ